MALLALPMISSAAPLVCESTGTGLELNFTPVPEPGTWLAAALLALAGMCARRGKGGELRRGRGKST